MGPPPLRGSSRGGSKRWARHPQNGALWGREPMGSPGMPQELGGFCASAGFARRPGTFSSDSAKPDFGRAWLSTDFGPTSAKLARSRPTLGDISLSVRCRPQIWLEVGGFRPDLGHAFLSSARVEAKLTSVGPMSGDPGQHRINLSQSQAKLAEIWP